MVCLAQATSYVITTIAGNGTAGFTGDGGAATSATLNTPIGLAMDASGNLYISDSANNRIRKVTSPSTSSAKISTVVGAGGGAYSGDGGAATSAQLNAPQGIWVDLQGNLDIADLLNHVIRQVSGGNINTIVGTNASYGFAGDGGPANSAWLNQPFGVTGDAAGNLYVSDIQTQRVRIVTPNGNINTLVGTGWSTFGCANQAVNVAAQNVTVQKPLGLAADSTGNLYIADSQNNCIRMVTPGPGKIVTVAGNGTSGFSGDGGAATGAKLNHPYAAAVDSSGDVFIADYDNSRIRMVTPDGNITTIAGGTGFGYTGDNTGIVATNAKLNFPTSLAVDNAGHVYIADSANNVVRMLTPMGPSVSNGGVISNSGFGALPAIAPGSWIEIHGSNLSTDARLWNGADFQGTNAPQKLDGTSVTIGGAPAYVEYISGSQLNAQVPSGVAAGQQPLVVQTAYGSSSSFTVNVSATAPGLWAPSSFSIGGTQYAGAVFSDGKTFVLPAGAIPGYASRPAKAGEIITLYGIGFGPVNGVSAGQTAPANAVLANQPQFLLDQTSVNVQFAGLAPGLVGLYQFNLVVPSVAAGTHSLTFNFGGQAGTQKLYVVTQ